MTGGAHTELEHLLYEVKKIVVGQDAFLERVLIALLAGGHLLVEGVPGLAKTLTVATLARAMQGSFKRIQFTPDLVPADLIGTRIYNQKSGEFATVLGPVFANLVLADEINRAPAKVQSALLEVMQERQVTIAGESHPVPRPFVVMATQNPIETEGTYALPEAQIDRFMMKVLVGYPSEEEEFVIVQRVTGVATMIGAVASADSLLAMQAQARKVYVDPSLVTYAVKLVAATRDPAKAGLPDHGRYILYGASPRATIGLIEAGRAFAFLRGRDYVLPADVTDIAMDVLRHRVVPSYEALAEGISADKLVRDIMRGVPAPEKVLAQNDRAATPDALLRRLDLKIARRLDGLLQGDHKSAARGQGMDFADLREYQHHDDVRHIDWNVTARQGVPHVREFLEEREVTAWFLLDMSPSIDFRSVSVSKRAVLADFTVLMCRLLAGKGNRAGAMLFSGGVEQMIPARGGRQQFLILLDAVTRYRGPKGASKNGGGATDLKRVLADAGAMIRRRSLIFIVSDFISAPGWEKPLGQLAARHDVIAVRLTDPLETRLPDLGLLTFQDAENGEQLFVDTHDRGFRARFARAAAAREEALAAAFQAAGVDSLELSTEDDIADACLRFADMRKRRANAPSVAL